MTLRANIKGEKFGRLTVINRAENDENGQVQWLCNCNCGKTAIVYYNSLLCGDTRSCGCLWREMSSLLEVANIDANRSIRDTRLTHGHAGIKRSRTYQSWLMMRQRCRNPRVDNYKYYGGRGIRVCNRWDLFENFLADMGERPDGKTLDRYPDNNGNYEPGNCRWATLKQQRANQRQNAA